MPAQPEFRLAIPAQFYAYLRDMHGDEALFEPVSLWLELRPKEGRKGPRLVIGYKYRGADYALQSWTPSQAPAWSSMLKMEP